MTTAAPKRPRTASDTKQQLIERTVAKQMGVCAVSHVQIKWTLGGTMRESADLAAVAAARPVFASVQADFEQAVAAAATQLHLWPPATLTRLASCATNGHLGHGDLQRARRCLEAFVGSFDPTIDMALIQKRKQIDLIKKTQLKAVQLAGSHSHKEEEEEEEDLLPLTRNDWTLVRLLVSFYFVLLGPVYVETLSHGSKKNDEYATLCGGVIPELDVQYRLIPLDATQSSDYYSEAQVQVFLATYGNYINLDWAAMVCSVRQFPQALSDVLNLAISSSESIAADCEDMLHQVAEGIPFEFPRPSAVCVCLHLLHVLLKTTKQAAVDWCVLMYPRVSPWNVQWALFGASVDFDQTNSTYLSYLTTLLQKVPASRGDASIITHWLHMHFAQRQAEDILLAFLQYPSVYMHPDVSALCFKHGRWSCLVQIVLHASDGPASSLSAIFHAMMQLDNPGRPLQYILEEVEAYMQDTALDGVSKDNRVYVGILHALFDACGPQLGLRLLDTCPTLIKLAPRQLYAAVVHMQALQHAYVFHAEQVTHMLEDIDTYIWSCSRSHHMGLAPQVEATFRLECGYYHLEKKNPPLPTTTTSSDTRAGEGITQDDSNLVRQFFESRSNDWGGEIQLQDWHCVHCDLPVVYFGAGTSVLL
ncbi:hypothetical protein DYB28_004527 [Aphanomyces astaci]|uniref:Uncharacterized protein n=1 Tax=Aphanomyces astaci TaxID=112090 RepID=A0A9X8E3E7_APHAT|nr:hypothetical protein DYB28_004527 [Aphanomyces astaci]